MHKKALKIWKYRVYSTMKLPKVFLKKKNHKKDVKRLMNPSEEKINNFALEELMESCQEFSKNGPKLNEINTIYSLSMELIEGLKYDKKDLEKLSEKLVLIKEKTNMGFYFSALVNNIIGDDDTITLSFENILSYLGFCLEKGTLVIEGNTGYGTGWSMKGGLMVVEGYAGRNTGADMESGKLVINGDIIDEFLGFGMEDGEIVVNGNVHSLAGTHMKGGKITINGNTGNGVGFFMKGGEIHIKGHIGKVYYECEGKIYHRGKRIK